MICTHYAVLKNAYIQCSTTCGEGSQARSVDCVWRQRHEKKKRSLAAPAPAGVCSNAEKPSAKRVCNEDNCAVSRKGQ